MNCSLSGSFVHGICQARILQWVAISFSRCSFFFFFKMTEISNLKKNIKYSRWLRWDPVPGEVGTMA